MLLAISCAIARTATSARSLAGAFLKDSRGVSTVEYALIVVAVVAIVGGAAVMLSGQFETLFRALGTNLATETGVAGDLNPTQQQGG